MPHRLFGHHGHVILDAARAAVTGGGLFVAGYLTTQGPVGSAASSQPGGSPVPVPGTEQFLDIAIRQGGLLLVLVIVLFFYRRDYHYLTEFWKQQNDTLVELVAANTKAQTDTAAALRETSVVVHQAKTVMATHLPHRRDEDTGERELPPGRRR